MTAIASTPKSRLLTVREVAAELNVTERFVRKLIAQGDLEAVRIGSRLVRIRRSDVEELLRPISLPGGQLPR